VRQFLVWQRGHCQFWVKVRERGPDTLDRGGVGVPEFAKADDFFARSTSKMFQPLTYLGCGLFGHVEMYNIAIHYNIEMYNIAIHYNIEMYNIAIHYNIATRCLISYSTHH